MHLGRWGKGGPRDLLTTCPSPSTENTGPLRVDRPQTYDFLKSLLGEVADRFPDEVFHGGKRMLSTFAEHSDGFAYCCCALNVAVHL